MSSTFDLMLSGTASDSDYTVSSTSVVMDTGIVEATASLTIIDDAEYEEEETIVDEKGCELTYRTKDTFY